MTDSDLDALWRSVLEGPDHHAALLVYADAVQEFGEDREADGWRWLGRKKRWPVNVRIPEDEPLWRWSPTNTYGSGYPHCLPDALCDRFPALNYEQVEDYTTHIESSSLPRLLEDFITAWLITPLRLHRELWRWEPSA